MTPMKSRKTHIPTGLRRTLAAVAITAVAVAGWQLNSADSLRIGVIGLPGATADPTGPPGPTGGLESGGGSQFQPPGLPPQQPDYQGGINQPPLDQNNGISIYNTGAQGAPQQAGQQGAQQGNPGQQPQHGTQIPDYQTATPYTQGPGKANPDYQTPQQGNQGQQPQQQQQPNREQDPPQNKQDQDTQQLRQRCQDAALVMGSVTPIGGGGRIVGGLVPGRDPTIIPPPWPSEPPENLVHFVDRLLECNCIDQAGQAVGKTLKDFDKQIRQFMKEHLNTECTALYMTCLSVADKKLTRWLKDWGPDVAAVGGILGGLACAAIGSAVPIVGNIGLGAICAAAVGLQAVKLGVTLKLIGNAGSCVGVLLDIGNTLAGGNSLMNAATFVPIGGSRCV